MLVIFPAAAAASLHVGLSRRELADFVLGKGVPAKGGDPLARLDCVLDESRLLPATSITPALPDAKGAKCRTA